jgi:enoyl-CoA hydratase/carnithine racemase
METNPIILDREDDGRIAIVRLNRPSKRNALNAATKSAMRDAFAALAEDRGVRVVIVTGSGAAFAAGSDIAELRNFTAEDAMRGHPSGLFRQVEDFPHPVVAAVNGLAIGGGLELALACDLRIAARGAKFGLPEVDLGTFPVAGATYRLMRLVGVGRAKELIYTGRTFGADEALAMRLVEEVVDDADLMERARDMARRIAMGGDLATRMCKAAMNAAARGEPLEGLLEVVMTGVLNGTEERKQRMDDFLEKRGKWAR